MKTITKYISEIDGVNGQFDTEKELVEAEAAFLKKKEAAEAKKKEEAEKKAKRAERAKEVEDAFKAVSAAQKKANKLLDAFVKDYGSFHTTFTDEFALPSFNSIFDLFF